MWNKINLWYPFSRYVLNKALVFISSAETLHFLKKGAIVVVTFKFFSPLPLLLPTQITELVLIPCSVDTAYP